MVRNYSLLLDRVLSLQKEKGFQVTLLKKTEPKTAISSIHIPDVPEQSITQGSLPIGLNPLWKIFTLFTLFVPLTNSIDSSK